MMTLRTRLALLAIAALVAIGVVPAAVRAQSTPTAAATPQLPQAPTVVTGGLLRFAGQLLDMQNGYVFLTTGDAFKLAPVVRIVDLATGRPTTVTLQTRMYVRLDFDTVSGIVTEIALSKKPIPGEKTFEQVKSFAVAQSKPVENPELIGRKGLSGKPVLVVFTVEVPSSTPYGDQVYIATDYSNWDPRSIHMDRFDALHYRVIRKLASGTKFAYRVTRGSWNSVERGSDGLEPQPHLVSVNEVDSQAERAHVYRWSDDNPLNPGQRNVGPGNIPTPFQINPFPSLPPGSTPKPPKPH